MRRSVWAALAAGALVAGGLTAVRPRDITAAPPAMAAPAPPATSESEIRSLDIAFYEHRVAEDSFSAADRARFAALYLQRARETGSYLDYDRAETIARQSLALREAHNAETYALLASALMAKHEFGEALRVARQLYATDPTHAGHTALLGEVELEVGDYASAARHFAAVARRVDEPSIAARLARWYEVTGQAGRARAILRRTAARLAATSGVPREQLAWFHYRLGELQMRAGLLAAADSSFNSALGALPTDYRALGGLARLAAARGDWSRALDWGSRAIAIQLDPATLGTMSDAYAALGDTAQARSFADAMAASALSQPGSIHRAWGSFLLDHDRDVTRVLREAQVGIATRRDVYGYDLLAWALYKAGRVAEAQRAAAAALSQDTEDASLFYHAGMIAAAAGDTAAARSRLARALALNPRFSATQATRARRALEALGTSGAVVRPVHLGGPNRV